MQLTQGHAIAPVRLPAAGAVSRRVPAGRNTVQHSFTYCTAEARNSQHAPDEGCSCSGREAGAQPAGRRQLLAAAAVAAALGAALPRAALAKDSKQQQQLEMQFGKEAAAAIAQRNGKVSFSDEEWAARLDPMAYKVLRHEATERPFSSPLNKEKRAGTFVCAGCGSPLFPSATKYDSGTGWPSFYDTLPRATLEVPDNSIPFMPRTEVRCATCQGHLGHVFEDGPRPTGLRYCMNGAAMAFQPDDAAA